MVGLSRSCRRDSSAQLLQRLGRCRQGLSKRKHQWRPQNNSLRLFSKLELYVAGHSIDGPARASTCGTGVGGFEVEVVAPVLYPKALSGKQQLVCAAACGECAF